MKKYLIILIAILALVFSIWGYMGLRSSSVSKQVDVFTALPEIPYSLIRINQVGNLSNALLYDNSYWQDVSNLANFHALNDLIVHLDSIKENELSIQSFLSNRTIYFASFIDSNETVSNLWFAQISQDEWSKIENIMLKNIPNGYFFAYENGIFLVSADKKLINRSLQQIKSETSVLAQEKEFESIYKTAGKQAVFNWIFNMHTLCRLELKDLTEQGERMMQNMRQYAKWCCFDGIIEGDKLTLNGFAQNAASTHYTTLLQQQETKRNTLVERMPYNTYFYFHLSLSDIDAYRSKLETLASKDSIDILSDGYALETPTGESPLLFFREFFGGEIAYAWSPVGPFVVVKLIEPKRASDKLKYMVEDMGYGAKCKKEGGFTIYTFPSNGFAGCVFGNYYTLNEEHIIVIDDKMVIAPTSSFARYIAGRKSNTQTLQCSPNYQDANRSLLTESNLSMYINLPYMVRNAERFVSGETLAWVKQTQSLWKNFSTFCLQAENDLSGNSFQHLFIQYNKVMDVDATALLADNKAEEMPEATETEPTESALEDNDDIQESHKEAEIEVETESEKEEQEPAKESTKRTISNQKALCSASLDYPAVCAPQLVKNHYTGENEIAIQDSHNQLYLIDGTGKILWKKSLSERLLGAITQIDLYKNNKLQMAFVTEKHLYVIDRNGQFVKGFPITLPQEATQGLSVCDYDGNKNYRFFVTCNKGQILLIKADGTSPSDWQFTGSKESLLSPVQYLKQQNKDFLVTYNEDKCYFLNRQGKERIHADNQLKKAQNGLFYADAVGSNHRFIATSPNGEMLYIYGNDVQKSSLKEYSKNHLFTLFKGNYGNYYIFLDKQGLDVYDRDMNLYMQDEQVVGGNQPTLLMHGSKMAVYDSQQSCWIIYNLVSKRKAYQIFASDTPLAYFGNFKPYASPCLVVTEGKQLKWYKINEKVAIK